MAIPISKLTESRPWNPEWSPDDEREIERIDAAIEEGVSQLKAVRMAFGLTQAELARILQTTQSNVSKLEMKGDLRLSVLRRLIEARGGRAHIVAEIDGKEFVLPL